MATREVLAAYLGRVRAVDTDADRIVVCSGFAQGLAITLRALARRGLTRVACEDPGSIGTVDRRGHGRGWRAGAGAASTSTASTSTR